ncbi:MAG TPA: hypothetical protein V6C91_16950 [Coleofasciculaceae cyanobacterium]
MVAATAEPFVQAILDLGVPQMGFEQVALVGDAAFISFHAHIRQRVRLKQPRMREAKLSALAASLLLMLSLNTITIFLKPYTLGSYPNSPTEYT